MVNITHVIFDLGGTLIDIDPLWDFMCDLAVKCGKSDGLPDKLKGLLLESDANGEGIEFFVQFCAEIRVTDSETKAKLMTQILTDLPKVIDRLVPGVDRLVSHLHRHGIHMAIATNATKPLFTALTSSFADFIAKYFTHWVCGGDDPDVPRNKPDPRVYHVCAQRFPTRPASVNNVLIVEDSLRGICGALESGMKTLLINDSKGIDLAPLASRVTCITDCFDNFMPQSVGLPAYD